MHTPDQAKTARALHDKVVSYWHDVDFNWGRNAARHYTEDGLFIGSSTHYEGRREIQAFYDWRQERGARTNVHLVGNFHCEFEDEDTVRAAWICTLYAQDGEPPQETAPPISIARVEDTFIRQADGEWLCAQRRWHGLFRGGAAPTSLSKEQMAARMASNS